MDLITTTQELTEVCARMARHPFVTVDTEFLRETTYYPLLCVAQMASPDDAVVVDAEPPCRRRHAGARAAPAGLAADAVGNGDEHHAGMVTRQPAILVALADEARIGPCGDVSRSSWHSSQRR